MDAKALLEIIRPANCLIAAFAGLIGYSISVQAIQWHPLLLPMVLAIFFVCAGGQTINDFFDRKIDQKLSPKKPIPSGRLKPKPAFTYSILLFFIGCSSAYFINLTAFIIAVAFAILLFAYSALFRKVKYLGNFIVAFGTGFTLVFGATISGNYLAVSILAAAAILANMSRELLKDLEQKEVEKGIKITLPQKISVKACNSIVFIYYLLAIILSYVIALLAFSNAELVGFIGLPYLVLVSAANLLFVASFRQALALDFKKGQTYSKYGMVIALLAFLSSIIRL